MDILFLIESWWKNGYGNLRGDNLSMSAFCCISLCRFSCSRSLLCINAIWLESQLYLLGLLTVWLKISDQLVQKQPMLLTPFLMVCQTLTFKCFFAGLLTHVFVTIHVFVFAIRYWWYPFRSRDASRPISCWGSQNCQEDMCWSKYASNSWNLL